jgi:hypothetical protein
MYNPEANSGVLLSEYLQLNLGIEIVMEVYNMITLDIRKVKMTPKPRVGNQNA